MTIIWAWPAGIPIVYYNLSIFPDILIPVKENSENAQFPGFPLLVFGDLGEWPKIREFPVPGYPAESTTPAKVEQLKFDLGKISFQCSWLVEGKKERKCSTLFKKPSAKAWN